MSEEIELIPNFEASVAISVFYEAEKCLKLVFESILRDPIDSRSLQLFVLDDCCPAGKESINKVIDEYKDRFGEVQYFRHDRRSGFRKTFLLQRAIDGSSGSVFVFFDGDCVFTGDSLTRMVQSAKKGDYLYQAQRVFLFSSCIDYSLDNLDAISDFSELRTKFYADNTKTRKNIKRFRDSVKAQKSGESPRFKFASGYFMAIRTDLAKKVGLQPAANRGFIEDTDFAMRLYEQEKIDVLELSGVEVLHLFEHH